MTDNINDDDNFTYPFPMNLQFYQFQLLGSYKYEECMDALLERMKVIELVHDVRAKKPELNLNEQATYLLKVFESNGCNTFAKLFKDKGQISLVLEDTIYRKLDYISFVFLCWSIYNMDFKLAERWWYEGELYLFKLRASLLDDDGVVNFVANNQDEIPCPTLDKLKKLKLETYLKMYGDNFLEIPMYIMPRKDVRHLIRKRLVFHRGNDAILTPSFLRPELYQFYNKILTNHLEETAVFFNSEKIDMMIIQLIQQFSRVFLTINFTIQLEYLGQSFQPVVDLFQQLKDINIDNMAKNLFPPCMQKIHQTLRVKHLLKNSSRLQYYTNLLNFGMSYDTAYNYIKTEYLKLMSPDKFVKEYEYNIKHTYGLVGKKEPYPAKSCKAIINWPVTDESNGCPFVTDIEDLVGKMKQENFSNKSINVIKKCAANGNCGAACAKYFAEKYKCDEPNPITYPENYLLLSFKKKQVKQIS